MCQTNPRNSIIMEDQTRLNYLKEIVKNSPSDWLNLTTHRLDIFDEKMAKGQFLDQFEALFEANDASRSSLKKLPTAYDYIRLGHPLSCILEWSIAHSNQIAFNNVISFSSSTMPILAILRTNLLAQKKTRIVYNDTLPHFFDKEILQNVYAYSFDLVKLEPGMALSKFDGSTLFIIQHEANTHADFTQKISAGIDFNLGIYGGLGSVLIVNGPQNENYIAAIQHVRRRETIAMTPANCLIALNLLTAPESFVAQISDAAANKHNVLASIASITGSNIPALMASSGLSIQYAIMMGLVHDAQEKHPGKAIKFIVPPNCYGGTNDQARRVAACVDKVEIVDLPVDGANDMVQSIESILAKIAQEDAIPYIIAEIPTNPRVEVPDLQKLKEVLILERKTANGSLAIDPVFILDQTFCPNVHFLGEGAILSKVRTISYVSGSKFPSGGRCTAGYCVGNKLTLDLLDKIALHLRSCDNEATPFQLEILAQELPSMNQRIQEAYQNTREFVNYIHETLPDAKINFVSEALAADGFTPSVFSLDLPTKGNTDEERETYKRALNLQLIHLMIHEIPDEAKFCVSYGQLKGSYWTIPATSTQGTTKEGDKDYIVRVSLAPKMNLDLHKKVFLKFVEQL